jgi:hypothetical protein
MVPTLSIINSHDGGSSLRVIIGFTRLVCLNGLTVGEDLGSFTVRHVGVKASMSELEARLAAVAERFDRLFTAFVHMQSITATVEHRHRLVAAALVIQYGEEEAATIVANEEHFRNAVDQLTSARRGFDLLQSDLFTVANIIQENMVKGHLAKPGARRKAGIRSAIRQEKVTTRLMDYAVQLAAQAA